MRFAVALMSFAAVVSALAQTNVGQISGLVTDASGAAAPECTVTATSALTGRGVSVKTAQNGFYLFPSLPAGTYHLRAEAPGFRASERSGVVLNAASRRSIDFWLEVGAVTDSVTVPASLEQVQTSSGDVGRVIPDRQLSQIALNGRNYAQMLRLIPGAVTTSVNPFTLGLSTAGQRINGIRSNSIYFTVDGADNMDNGGNSNAIVNPNLDAIAEIKVLASSYSAEFGGRSGALVNVVTKSGARQFHGTLFEFVRHDALDARSFFATRVDPLRFNDFGWTLGGPAHLPGKRNAGRNKAFFFAAQEWKYNHQGETRLSTIPTLEERAGDFRSSRLTAPVDPANNQPFPNRMVPPARFSKNGPLLLKPYPGPNFADPGGNLSVTRVNHTDTREDSLKVDYLVSAKTQLIYRWTHDEWDIWQAFQGGNTGIVPGGRPRPGWTTIASLSHAFSPTTLNYFSFGVSANQIAGYPSHGILKRSALGLTFPEIYPNNQYQVGPDFSMSGFTGYTAGELTKNLNTTFQWRDDLSKVVGAHALKFGAQITRSRKDQNNFGGAENGSVSFTTSARNTTRNVVADALLGNFYNYTEGQTDTWWWARFNQWEFYGQDTWKVTRQVSLEFGLRYNIIAPLSSALGNFTTFVPSRFERAKAPQVSASDGSLGAGTGDPYNGLVIFGSGFPKAAEGRIPQASDPSLRRLFAGLPRGGVPTNYRDFSPRFGFAWDPIGIGKTVIRGGFGIFHDRIQSDYLSATSANPPFAVVANVYDGNIDSPGGATARRFPPDLTAIPARQPTPLVMSYNLGIQREFRQKVVADLSYVGTQGRHLLRTLNLNQLRPGARLNPPASTTNVNALRRYPGYANISVREASDNSNYNSLQLSVSRRIDQGLSLGANYTFSRTLDVTSGSPQDSYNAGADYGLSDIHRQHALNFHYIYALPIFRKHPNALVRGALGGWEISGITLYQSGAPRSVTVPTDVARIGVSSSRASLIGEPTLPASQRTLARWFNTEAFLPPERMVQGRFGDSGRNILIGPGFNQWDISVLKDFHLRERLSVQFRAESFNTWNHASFTNLNTTVRFDSAGKPTQNYGAVTAAAPGRALEFGLKLMF